MSVILSAFSFHLLSGTAIGAGIGVAIHNIAVGRGAGIGLRVARGSRIDRKFINKGNEK